MKKFICLLLCLMMLIPAAVSSAGHPSVGDITLILPVLKAGTSTMQPPDVTLPSNHDNYELTNTFWLNNDYTAPLSYPIQFVAGKTYNIGIALDSTDNQWFSQYDTINIKNGSLVKEYPMEFGKTYIQIVAKVTIPAEPTEKVALNKIKSVKLTAVSQKKLKLTWKKLSKKEQKKIQKFEIQYSTDKTFKTYKTKYAKKGKASYTIKGLKKNTKYWVRIRAYKKDGNTIYVSKWITKSKKTKKK